MTAEKKNRESTPWQVFWIGEPIDSDGAQVQPLVPEVPPKIYSDLLTCAQECVRLAAQDIGRTFVPIKIGPRCTAKKTERVEVVRS